MIEKFQLLEKQKGKENLDNKRTASQGCSDEPDSI